MDPPRFAQSTGTSDTYAYTLDEILKMLDVENATDRTPVIVAAFEGLSLSEFYIKRRSQRLGR
jgi:hypothetical protein